LIVLMSWSDFVKRENITIPDDATDAFGGVEGYFLKTLAELLEGYFERAPEFGERAWRIRGRKYTIVVWDDGNGWFTPIGVEIEVDKFKYVTRR